MGSVDGVERKNQRKEMHRIAERITVTILFAFGFGFIAVAGVLASKQVR